MIKRAETIFFFIAVLAALALPALPLLQELRPEQDATDAVASATGGQPAPQQVALAR
jgi:hypothetical protein